MKTSWAIGIFTLFIVMSFVSGIIELSFFASNQETVFERIFVSPALSWDTLFAFMDALLFDYAFFTGSWQIVRWVLFMPIGAGVAISLMLIIISAISNVVSGIGRLIRPGF